MSKFVSIYQEVIRRRTLRDDITVVDVRPAEVPILIQQELANTKSHREALLAIRQRDTQSAKERLDKIRQQIADRSKTK